MGTTLRELIDLQLHLVRHAGTRACLYFPPENGASNAMAENYSITVVTDGVSKLIDGMRRKHLFQKFFGLLRHQIELR